MVLLKFLVPVLFIVFALGELLRIQLPSSIGIGLIDLVVFFIFLIWIIFIKKTKYQLFKPLVLFTSIAGVSLLLNIKNFESQQILVSSLYLIRFTLYASLYFVFADIGKQFGEKTKKYMTISGLLILIIGLLQYFLYPSLKNLYYLGWDEHMHRLFSSFMDPNFAGVILVLFFVFFFILRDKITRDKKHLSYGILILNFIAIVLTYSRGALLMFFSSVFIYSVIIKQWKIIGGTLILFAVLFVALSPWYYIENTNLLRTFSTKERIKTSEQALKIFKENPLGVGFNTYRYAREKYGDRDGSLFGPSHAGAGVDNSFILVLVTTGIPGLIAYVYLLFKMFMLGFSKIDNRYGLVLAVSLFGLVINALFLNSLFYSFVMIWVWVLAGLTERS